MLTSVGLKTHIWNNRLRSGFLLAMFPVLLMLMMFAFYVLMHQHPDTDIMLTNATNATLENWHWAFIIGGAWFTIAYFFHTRMINSMTGAKPITRAQYPKLYNMLENLCISRGLPMPKFAIIDSPALNAFASGINRNTYTITLTRGIISALRDDELEAVIAHELTHIINDDVRLLIISMIFVGIFSIVLELTVRRFFYRTLYYGGSRGSRNNANGVALLIAFALIALGYLFAMLIRFTLSRSREYMADAGAVELTRNPHAMIRALEAISGVSKVEGMPDEIAEMCIDNDVTGFMGMFATHPPIEKRIAVLRRMTGTPAGSVPAAG